MPDLWMDVDAALSEVPINKLPLIDDTDFKTREESVTYNQSGLDLLWNFVTTAGAFTQTAVTPTDTAGDYDWVNQGNGLYTIEIPASGGASINNASEGFGWFTGFATGILPWAGPIIGFRAAALNNALVDGGVSLDVNVTAMAAAVVTSNAIATDAIGAAELAADAINEIADQVWDEILTGATHNIATSAGRRLRGIQEFQGYEGGAIWIDTVNGTAGTTDFENGTVENPVNSIADANTLSASLGFGRFSIAPGSSITFVAAQDDQVFHGKNWTLALGGQSISGSHFFGASVSGVGTGASAPTFEHCIINTTTLPATHFDRCGFATTLTFGAAGSYIFENCFSEVAGTSAPIFDLGAAIGNEDFHFRDYSGGIDLRNMGQTGTDSGSIEGRGNVILNANCVGGTLVIRGALTKEDNSATVTITDGARIDVAQVVGYLGPRGPGVYIDDAAANTGTALGTDGTVGNPVSTIAAATTIATSLGSQRFYLVNDSAITLAQTYESYEFTGIGEMSANSVDLGSQDVDKTTFYNLLLTGAQGGTGRCQAEDCVLSVITGMEITALRCLIAAGTLTLRNDCAFDSCFSAVAGGGTPILDVNSVAGVNVHFRHYSGGLQVDNAVSTTVMSYDCPTGQLVVGATCTSLTVHVRGNCSYTDNGTTTNDTLDAAVNRTAIGDVVWDEAKSGHVAAGSFGEEIQAHALSTEVSALNDLSAAEVASEISDALRIDTISELAQGDPSNTPTFAEATMRVYMALIHKIDITSSAKEFHNAAGTVIWKKALSDDGTTYTEAESATGP